MTPEQALDKASKAERLLSDPTLQAAFDSVRSAIVERIESCPLRDKEGLYDLRLMLKILSDVRANLEKAVRDGKVAAHDLKTRNEPLSPAEWRALT